MKGGREYLNNIKKYNSDDMSKLPDLFKELQDIRYGRAKPKHMESPNELRDKIKYRKIKYTNKKFNAIGAIIGK